MKNWYLRELAKQGKLVKLRVKNFKSLRNVEIEFPTKLTILIGPNGSGKTALIEALELLHDIVEYRRGRIVNPFIKWWNYRSIVWRGENLPIEISLYLDFTEISRFVDGIDIEYKELWRESSVYVEYTIAIREIHGVPSIIEKIRFPNQGFEISFTPDRVIINIVNQSLFEEFLMNTIEKKIIKHLKELDIESLMAFIDVHLSIYSHYGALSRNEISELKQSIERIGRESIISQILSYLPELREYIVKALSNFEFSPPMRISTLLDIYLTVLHEIERGVSNYLDGVQDVFRYTVMRSFIPFIRKLDKPITKFIAMLCIEKFIRVLIGKVVCLSTLIGAFIDGIIVVRGIDLVSLRQPQILMKYDRLDPEARNLIPLLFSIGKGRLPEDMIPVLKAILSTDNISGYFEPTVDGRIVLKLVIEGVEVPPVGIPSGVWKALAIETALSLKPTLIAIDEFENSLHAEAQKYLLDELRNSNAYVIIATHSPVPIDYAHSLDEILILELVNGETRSSRIRGTEDLQKKLMQLGLTPSEAILYGFVKPSE